MRAIITYLDEINIEISGVKRNDMALLIKKTSVKDPTAFTQAAYRIGTWDGLIPFIEDNITFSYLVPQIKKFLETLDYEVLIDKSLLNNQLPLITIDENFLLKETGKKLREHQVRGANIVLSQHKGVLEYSTSSGKTLLCLAVSKAVDPYMKSLVVVPNQQLLDQTYSDYSSSDLSVLKLSASVKPNKREEMIASHRHIIVTDKLFVPLAPVFARETYAFIKDECFHPSHELLTDKGWKPVADVAVDDYVVGYDPITNSTLLEKVEATITKHFSGELCHLSNKGRVNLLVTPNHETPIFNNGKHRRIKMCDYKPSMTIPISGELVGDYELTAMEKLRIAFEADGHHLRTDSNGMYTYRFMFRRERKINRLIDILNDLGIEYKHTVNQRGDTSITFKSYELLTKDFDWFDMFKSGKANHDFIIELGLWDGYTKENGIIQWNNHNYNTIMQLQDIGRLGGFQSLITMNTATMKDESFIYRIEFRKKDKLKLTDIRMKHVHYEGDVHCVSVPSKNLLTRLHGVVSITGNCQIFGETLQDALRFDTPNFPIRIGLTGSFPKCKLKSTKIMCHLGGGILDKVEPQDMKNIGATSKEIIKIVRTTHPEIDGIFDELKTNGMYDWSVEQDYYLSNKDRAVAIGDYIMSLPKSNTLVLCHANFGVILGKYLSMPMINDDVDVSTRAEYFSMFDKGNDDHIQLASFGCAATGISVNTIHRVILIDIGKNRTYILQSIGRGLRKSDHQEHVDVIDIYADMKYGNKHKIERVAIYKEKNFDYTDTDEIITIK
jgi:superfamily II DNA or RNA helicase